MNTITRIMRRKSFRLRVWKTLNAVVGVVTILNVSLIGALIPQFSNAGSPPPSVDLDQCRNGSAASHQDCIDGNWGNGNAGSSNSHYVEGESIPYRIVMENLPTSGPITLVLGYDNNNSSKHAIDYLTQYDRTDVNVDPIHDIAAASGVPSTFAIPAPSSVGSPVTSQPTTSFNALPAGERVMSIWNASISDIHYTSQGNLTATQSETTISITFTPNDPTVVMSWGGHIGSRLDWGVGLSAGGIKGSPYHIRLNSWGPNLPNLGNTDRSLSANAIVVPATIIVQKQTVPDGSTQSFAFSGSVNGSIGDGQSLSSTVQPGTYTVTEDSTTDWTLTDLVCDDDDSTVNINTRTTTFNVAEGENVTCVYTNTRDTGTITFQKVVPNFPKADLSSFHFQIDGTGDYQNGSSATLPIGKYDITESVVPSYYHFVKAEGACSGTSKDAITLTVDAAGGTCTITNERDLGGVKIIKDVGNGSIDPQSWKFRFGSINGMTSGDTAWMPVGDYSLAEYPFLNLTDAANYTLTGMSGACEMSTTPATTLHFAEQQGIMHVLPGENVCTVTNTRIPLPPVPGSLTVIKHVIGGTSTASNFTLHVTNGTPASFPGNETGTTVSIPADTDFAVSEDSVTGYTASFSTDCRGTMPTGGSKTCTVTNTRDTGTIELIKVWSGTPGQTTLNIGTTNGGSDVKSQLTGAAGVAPLTTGASTVTTGTYFVSETGGLTDYLSTLACTDNGTPFSIGTDNSVPVTAGHAVICTFTNTKKVTTLSLTKAVDDTTLGVNQTVNYTIAWNIAGNSKATNVILTDSLPATLNFVSTDNGGTYDVATRTITWNLGTKNPGDSGSVKVTATTFATMANGITITNNAAIKATETDPMFASASSTAVVPQVLGAATQPILSITKTANVSSAKTGSTIVYSITVQNTGDGDATNVVVTDTLPAGLSFIGTTDTTTTWNVGTLSPDQSRTLAVDATVKGTATGSQVNTASATADDVDAVEATATVKVPSVLGLSTTGAGILDYLIALMGAGCIALGVFGLKKRGATK